VAVVALPRRRPLQFRVARDSPSPHHAKGCIPQGQFVGGNPWSSPAFALIGLLVVVQPKRSFDDSGLQTGVDVWLTPKGNTQVVRLS